MSKVGGALPSWYWPAGVPRRVPVAQRPLGKLLRERFALVRDRQAIISSSIRCSYGELLDEALKIAGGIQATALSGTTAISDDDPAQEIMLLLGVLFAGGQALISCQAVSGGAWAAQSAEAQVSALLSSGEVTIPELKGPRLIRKSELQGAFSEAGAARRATEPAVFFTSPRGLVAHSHFSLFAMVASMAAFIVRLRETPFVCTAPTIGSWEMMTGILLALYYGTPIVFSSVSQSGAPRFAQEAKGGYLILDRRDADAVISSGVPGFMRDASYIFVSTGFFEPRWRRRLEAACRRPVFPIWGLPELGPLVAPHPTWLPPHGHGLPLVNVSLVPIDPGSGKVSIVPWEMLEQAEVGVETLSAMIGYANRERGTAMKVGTALRTGQIASMDHVGVVALQALAAAESGDGGN